MISLPQPIQAGKSDNGNHGGKDCIMRFDTQLKDYRLTTAEILYHLPDHPNVLQSYVWQDLDIAPQFPVLNKFLDFWKRELDGAVHSVRVASAKLITPGRYRHADAVYRMH